ncbi:hypothetical protein BJF79_44050 [Actinomadura sp. CNU-125]|nr:hypothetical protein BJF79_44050 [Actinomadura sp. CNU-125]
MSRTIGVANSAGQRRRHSCRIASGPYRTVAMSWFTIRSDAAVTAASASAPGRNRGSACSPAATSYITRAMCAAPPPSPAPSRCT